MPAGRSSPGNPDDTPGDGLELDLLPERFAVVRLGPARGCPEWALDSGWLSVTTTADETSVVCHERVVPRAAEAERGLRCLRVRGPLPFSQTGILEALARPLAAAGIPIFAISTYETDHLLVADARLEAAFEALSTAGHRLYAPPEDAPLAFP